MRRSGVSIALVAALLLALGSTAPSAGAAVEVTTIVPNVGSIVSIAFDDESDHLFLYPEYGVEILEFTVDGRMVDGIPVPGNRSNDIDLDFALESLTVGGQSVPANTLLVGNGDGGNTLYAIDKSDGSIEAQQVAPSNSIVGAAQNPPGDSFMTLSWTDDVINDFDPADGDLIRSLPVIPEGAPAFDVFYGDVDVDRDTGNIFVVSSSQNVIRQLSNSGQWLGDEDVYNENNTTAATNMHAMSGLAIDDDRNLAYVSSTSGTVWRVSDLVGTTTEPKPEPEPEPEPEHDPCATDPPDPDAICGGSEDETLEGTPEDEYISGGGGDDKIDGGGGEDVIVGGAGKDVLTGGEGSDVISGGAGNDKIFGDSRPSAHPRRAENGAGLYGSLQGDGTVVSSDDELSGGAGNDTISGGGGNDGLEGGTGIDSVQGGSGNDAIGAGGDKDTVDGGGGNDKIEGEGGNDALKGAAGNDVLKAGAGVDKMNGGPGKDTCVRSSRKDKTISCERKPLQPPKGAVRLRLSRY